MQRSANHSSFCNVAQVCSGTTTIQNSGDATALAACQTFTGDIVIQTDTSDNIALDGIERIEGSLRATNNSKITEISSNTLGSITQEFHLDQLQVLSSLKFPKLSRVQTISWNALAALQQLTFTTGVQLAATVDIENTQLNSLSGINLAMVQRFIITNNPYLKDINLQLGNITEALRIEANAPDLDVEFPNLMWAFNVTFRNCSKISIPSLASVNGSMGFYGGNYDTLAAPNLTSVGQTLSIVSNSKLSNISMPNLTTIGGGFQLANNSALEKIDGFGALKTVGGALDFKGNFKRLVVVLLPLPFYHSSSSIPFTFVFTNYFFCKSPVFNCHLSVMSEAPSTYRATTMSQTTATTSRDFQDGITSSRASSTVSEARMAAPRPALVADLARAPRARLPLSECPPQASLQSLASSPLSSSCLEEHWGKFCL